jgi:PAS domain S-box-containing protein
MTVTAWVTGETICGGDVGPRSPRSERRAVHGDGGDAVPSSNRVSMAAKGALRVGTRFADLGERARAIAVVVVGLVVVAALTVPLRDWDDGNAVLAAFGILVAATAGALGGIVPGVLVGLGGWALHWTLVTDESLDALIALPAWVAAGALTGWLVRQLRRAALEREDELQAAKEQLATSDAQYGALTQSLPLVTYIRALDSTRAPTFVSDQIERLTGYTPDQWRRDPELFLQLVHPDDRERVRDELGAAIEHTEPFRTQYRLRTRDGRLVWVRDEAVPVLGADGQPFGLQGWMLDVSERRIADEDRRQLRAAEASANAGALDRQRKTDFLAKAATRLPSSRDYEAAMTEVAALAVQEIADWCVVDRLEEDGTVTRIAAERAESSGTVEPEVDVRDVVRSRRPRVTESELVVPLVSHGGRALGALTLAVGGRRSPFHADDLSWAAALAGMAALAIDTSRLQDEVEARAEADRVLSYVGDGVFLLDRAGVVRLWNPMAEAITGLSADVMLGRAVGEALPGWERIAERVPVGPAGQPGTAEALPLETEAGERWISISGVEFFGGTVYAFRDITDAHRLDELQAEFIATASHELRTPLAAVYGAAQTLRRHDFALDESGRERFISLIVDESERLGRIVNQILLANQLEMGRLDLETEAFDARELLERVVEAARTHAPPYVRLEVAVGEAVPPVAADKDHVRQILINLVENAIKYSPDGGTIELGADAIDGMALFHVFDEGMGIPDDEQPRVFEKFYRLDPNMTRGIGGTGLGLYICSELVERMGGRIWVESRQRKGSAFYFEIPTVGVGRVPGRAREVSGIERAGH